MVIDLGFGHGMGLRCLWKIGHGELEMADEGIDSEATGWVN